MGRERKAAAQIKTGGNAHQDQRSERRAIPRRSRPGEARKGGLRVFSPQFVELSQRPGKLRLLFDMISFECWNAGALYDEVKFDLKHANDFERVAPVGDKEWERVMALLIKPFTKAKTRYFDATQYAAARERLSE
jgi:hypothetical protein